MLLSEKIDLSSNVWDQYDQETTTDEDKIEFWADTLFDFWYNNSQASEELLLTILGKRFPEQHEFIDQHFWEIIDKFIDNRQSDEYLAAYKARKNIQ